MIEIKITLAELAKPGVADALTALTAAMAAAVRPSGKAIPTLAHPQGSRERYDAFCDAIPDRSALFLRVLEREAPRAVGIAEMMGHLGVENGKAMGGVTGSIARWAPEHGVSVPYASVKGADGRRAWEWLGITVGVRPKPVPARARRVRR